MRHGHERRLSVLAAAALALLTACDRPSRTDVAAAQSAATTAAGVEAAPGGLSGRTRFGALRVSSAPDGPVLSLGDTAVLRSSELPEGAEALSIRAIRQAGGADLVLVAALGGAACPATFHVLEIAGSRSVQVSDGFGTCSDLASVRSEGRRLIVETPRFSNAEPVSGSVRFIYENGRVMEEGPAQGSAGSRVITAASLTGSWISGPGCRPFTGASQSPTEAEQAEADRLLNEFEARYPATLADPEAVESATIEPEAMGRLASCLAGLATWPGADPFVPEQAAALFASRRHGAAAFAALETVGASGDAATRSAATAFADQMRAYSAPRTE